MSDNNTDWERIHDAMPDRIIADLADTISDLREIKRCIGHDRFLQMWLDELETQTVRLRVQFARLASLASQRHTTTQ
jgi:hypothetical protein